MEITRFEFDQVDDTWFNLVPLFEGCIVNTLTLFEQPFSGRRTNGSGKRPSFMLWSDIRSVDLVRAHGVTSDCMTGA